MSKETKPAPKQTSAKPKSGKKKRQPTSVVEKRYLERSEHEFIYEPTEKIPVVQVDNFPELGKLTALRFVEWTQQNPGGVVSLPTGKTPEHFIRWVEHFVKNWETKQVAAELEKVEIDPGKKPDVGSLRFVQIDEFYPINSFQSNSFYYYIQKYYLNALGLDPKKALLMNVNEIGTAEDLPLDKIFPEKIVDLSLRTRWASNRQERLQKRTIEIVDEFCSEYERRIREMGGIGFFLGGIGPDGHIGFNVKGSDHFSTTRLIPTNYETQAAAAGDLGGIEIARNRLVITIGLDTIAYNKDATAIIIAAGEAKSRIVRDSIQKPPSNLHPATALQQLDNARFYLTNGGAFRLLERRYRKFENENPLSQESIERAVFNLSVDKRKPLTELTKEDYGSDRFASLALKQTGETIEGLNKQVADSVVRRFERGMAMVENERFLHTAPHHDDIMLGYLPYLNHLVRTHKNRHHFSYLTSGFTAVTNSYMLELLQDLRYLVEQPEFAKRFTTRYFDPAFVEGKNRDVNLYLDGIAANSETLKREAVARRMLRNIIEIFEEDNVVFLKDRIDELLNYFSTQYPGKKDITHVQKLKGMLREWEVEVLWAYFGFEVSDVSHLRLGFYQGKIFTENPEMNRDVMPIYRQLIELKPTVVTLALDPEGSGPDTHYKVLQAIAEALRLYVKETGEKNVRVWGYRNVWYRFHPAEANIYVPVSLNSMAIMRDTFMNSFGSQKAASFPSFEFDGPFCDLAIKIQDEQYQILNTCLGKDYFLNHDANRVRAAHGVLFMKELTLDEFLEQAVELRKLVENE